MNAAPRNYDLLRGRDFTDCPACPCLARKKLGAKAVCPQCGHEEPISANNARVGIVESLSPLGQEQ